MNTNEQREVLEAEFNKHWDESKQDFYQLGKVLEVYGNTTISKENAKELFERGFQAALAHSQKDEKPLWVKPKAYPESSVLCYLKLSNGKVIEGSCRRDWDGIGWYKGYPGMCNGFSMADPDVVGWMYKHQTKLTLEQLNAITNRKD